jgi:tetratricopeptide (TPR) repeat protein
MKIPFSSPKRKWLVASAALALALAYVGFAATQFAASWLASRPQIASLQRAAWLDRSNAEYRHSLGAYYDLVARDPALASAYYKSAALLNPHSARYWLDLSSAYQVLGDVASETAALERAIDADPMTPDVAWEAGNFYLVRGENEKALNELRVVVANDPSLSEAALQLCWRIQPDVDILLRDVLPVRSDSYEALLALLEAKQDTAGAAKVWDAIAQSKQPFEQRHAVDYIRYSIEHKEVDQAVRVWKEVANRFKLASYLPSHENLVVNGNFDLPVLNAGFDWQYQKQSSVRLSFDNSEHHAGRRSLQVSFDGPGIGDAGIYQFIPVQPNKTYTFSGYYKNEEMEGAGGPHFTIQDAYTKMVYYESDELKNSGFWKSADGEFTTAPDCGLIVLHMRRLPDGSPIRGNLWVGDFHLTQKPS